MSAEIDLVTLDLAALARRIERREVSSLEVTHAVLKHVESIEPRVHAFVTVCAELAHAQAREADREIAAGRYRGALHGVPYAAKDLIDTRGVATTCGSRILARHVPDRDATVVDRMTRAGAVLVGKLVMTEFAGIGYHPDVRPPRNPWNPDRWTGQSSSGSGVACAAGEAFATLGSDTGGSLRYPASACGVVGLRPTSGRVSRFGTFPLADTLDAIGPMTRTVKDTAIVLQAIAGYDRADPGSANVAVPDYGAALGRGIENTRLGVDEGFFAAADPEVAAAVRASLEILQAAGATVVPVQVPLVPEALQAWATVFTTECRAAHEAFYPSRADDYSEALREFLRAGEAVRGVDCAKAHAMRRTVRRGIDLLFENADALLLPTMGCLPPTLSDFPSHGIIPAERAGELLTYTAPFALSGHPALSVPCGLSRDKLPIGLQLVGPAWSEPLLLRIGQVVERSTDVQRHWAALMREMDRGT